MDHALTPESDFIRSRTSRMHLADGSVVLVRPIVPSDRDELEEGLGELSEEARYARFFRPVASLSNRELTYLTEIDYVDHFAWVAATDDDPPDGIGVARYIRLPDEPDVAEAAVVVLEPHQRRGIATILLELLAQSAIENGISHFRAYALPDNRAVIDALFNGGARVEHDGDDGSVRFDIALPPATGLQDSPMYSVLRATALGQAAPPLDPTTPEAN